MEKEKKRIEKVKKKGKTNVSEQRDKIRTRACKIISVPIAVIECFLKDYFQLLINPKCWRS